MSANMDTYTNTTTVQAMRVWKGGEHDAVMTFGNYRAARGVTINGIHDPQPSALIMMLAGRVTDGGWAHFTPGHYVMECEGMRCSFEPEAFEKQYKLAGPAPLGDELHLKPWMQPGSLWVRARQLFEARVAPTGEDPARWIDLTNEERGTWLQIAHKEAEALPPWQTPTLTKDAILKDASLESILAAAAVVLGKMMHAEHCQRSGVKPDHFSGFIAESWISKAMGLMNSMPKVS